MTPERGIPEYGPIYAKRLDFARRLTLMKHEAGLLELWRTMHALDDATVTVGWEIAGWPKAADRYMAQRKEERG